MPLAKALYREQAVRHLAGLIANGVPVESALMRTADLFSHFSASVSSLRRWQRAYARRGFVGLFESKAGRSGRKPSEKR